MKRAVSRTRAKVADEAAKKAKAAGGTGRRPKAQQLVLRNAAVVARSWAGTPNRAIATEFEISLRTVEGVLKEHREHPDGLNERPMEIVEQLSRAYREMYADLRALGSRYERQHPAAAIAAVRQARETLNDYVTLMASIGKLPTDLEVLAAQADLMALADLMLSMAELVERGEITGGELAERMRAVILARGDTSVIDGHETKGGDETHD